MGARIPVWALAAAGEVRLADARCARIRPIDSADGPRVQAFVAGLGETAVANALAAAAAALAAGASLAHVAEGLAGYRPVAGRLERRELPVGAVLIDDSYNANPQSMEVALRMLASSPAAGRRIAVLGDMGELGPTSDKAHRELGWRPAKPDLREIIADAWAFHQATWGQS